MRSVRAFMFLSVVAPLVCVLNVWMNSSEAPKVSMLLSSILLTLMSFLLLLPHPLATLHRRPPIKVLMTCLLVATILLLLFCCCCCYYVPISIPKTIGSLSLTASLTHCQLGLYYTSNPLTTHNNNNNNKNSE